MKVGAALFLPQDMKADIKYPAIIVGHPMGAVKEQSANLYATKMAERGFVTLSIDLTYWGESGGEARNAVSPDMYAETFSAAVDFLGTRTFVDRERIGAIGICGSGSFAVSAAKIDPPFESCRYGKHVRHGECRPQRTEKKHLCRNSANRFFLKPPNSATWNFREEK